MNSELVKPVEISLPKSVCLVLFDLLTDSYEKWRYSNPADSSASPMRVEAVEQAQRVALWRLEGELERTLPELFSSNFTELLAESKQLLS